MLSCVFLLSRNVGTYIISIDAIDSYRPPLTVTVTVGIRVWRQSPKSKKRYQEKIRCVLLLAQTSFLFIISWSIQSFICSFQKDGSKKPPGPWQRAQDSAYSSGLDWKNIRQALGFNSRIDERFLVLPMFLLPVKRTPRTSEDLLHTAKQPRLSLRQSFKSALSITCFYGRKYVDDARVSLAVSGSTGNCVLDTRLGFIPSRKAIENDEQYQIQYHTISLHYVAVVAEDSKDSRGPRSQGKRPSVGALVKTQAI